MAKQEKFVYFATRPTNVCFNGVSFPVLPGEVIKCYPSFIAAFIPEDKYKRVPPGSKLDERPVKHTFGASPVFLRPDPTGGLPVTSIPGPRKTKVKPAYSPATAEEREVNPYEMPSVHEERLEIGTGLDTPTSPEPRPESLTTAPPSERPEEPEEERSFQDDLDALLSTPERADSDAPEVHENDELSGEEDTSGEDIDPDNLMKTDENPENQDEKPELPIPGKTALRKLRRDEMYDLSVLHGLDLPEDSVRGTILSTLWKHFKYDEE